MRAPVWPKKQHTTDKGPGKCLGMVEKHGGVPDARRPRYSWSRYTRTIGEAALSGGPFSSATLLQAALFATVLSVFLASYVIARNLLYLNPLRELPLIFYLY